MTPERKFKLEKVLSQRQSNMTVVFENVEDPHNISACLRTCESVGIQDIYILNHTIPPHPKFGKEIGFKSSRSALKWLTIHYYDNVKECVKTLRDNGFELMAANLSAQSIDLYDVDFTQNIALVFGNERKGITEEMLSYCNSNFLIPQVGIIQSLNISVACAVTLYEAFRQKKNAGHYENISLPIQQLIGLKEKWGCEE
ncbi:MAG: RNA methyltransferase [Arachidicoccus sp.]|nr:RNA methyltransferase [Arachidicoccus sp.]